MAKHLARIHGTEEDKVNCPFYFKIGACRHSDRCSRLHHKPAFSPTLLIKHLYRHPVRLAEIQKASGVGSGEIDQEQANEEFLVFFEDLYVELSKFGRVEGLHVVENLGDHVSEDCASFDGWFIPISHQFCHTNFSSLDMCIANFATRKKLPMLCR